MPKKKLLQAKSVRRSTSKSMATETQGRREPTHPVYMLRPPGRNKNKR
jgi:hypothetical protein